MACDYNDISNASFLHEVLKLNKLFLKMILDHNSNSFNYYLYLFFKGDTNLFFKWHEKVDHLIKFSYLITKKES